MTPSQLKTLRASLCLTQTQMALKLGITRGQVAKIEAGERKISRPVALLALQLAQGGDVKQALLAGTPHLAPV